MINVFLSLLHTLFLSSALYFVSCNFQISCYSSCGLLATSTSSYKYLGGLYCSNVCIITKPIYHHPIKGTVANTVWTHNEHL